LEERGMRNSQIVSTPVALEGQMCLRLRLKVEDPGPGHGRAERHDLRIAADEDRLEGVHPRPRATLRSLISSFGGTSAITDVRTLHAGQGIAPISRRTNSVGKFSICTDQKFAISTVIRRTEGHT
jgi:hypothetical protein